MNLYSRCPQNNSYWSDESILQQEKALKTEMVVASEEEEGNEEEVGGERGGFISVADMYIDSAGARIRVSNRSSLPFLSRSYVMLLTKV